ncbi:Sec1-like protein [Macleaya cordata]|uniref:Sec1-like protein n=1 Tax=Macleaya cordata TaxID=56857 RepID=A0A200QEK2_MACCD|nr:Sec1-like protein [Macleaya cordata]
MLALAAASEQRSERRRPPSPRAAPWLVIPHGKGKKDQAFYNLCEPNIRTCRKFIPEMTRKSYWQKHSHQGWLVILCDDDDDDDGDKVDSYSNSNWNFGDCFLWDPVSLETIQLPNLLDWLNKTDQYWIRDCVLSSPPKSTNSDYDDSMVFFLFERLNESHEQILVFCRPGEDKQWRTKALSGYIVNDRVKSLISFKGGEFSDVETHYVESCDELFMIDKSYHPRADKVVTSIKVLRLDFSSMAWEKVKSFGDHVLFLGQKTVASCSAAELGLTRGCLYYTIPEDQSLYKFEVEDNGITVILPCLKLPTPWFPADWMMMPMTVRVADGRRRIEDKLGKDEEEDNKTSINNDEKENQGQQHNGGELEEARPWGFLNEDIVELIASYLHPVDYIYFRAVCKAYRSIIPAVNWRPSFTGIIKTTYLSPWLVFSTNNDTIYNFVYPMHNYQKCLMNLSELLVGATIRFSKGGWLLMSKGRKTLFFYNPFTRETIQLPDLPETYPFTGMSFSSLPTSSDCVVFGIAPGDTYEVSIFFIARGNDYWGSCIFENTNLQKYMPCINNPVFYDGAFYCLDYNGTLGVFNLEDGFIWKVLAKPQEHFSAVYPSFLVECDGKLLSVDIGPLGNSVGICRLDFSKMVWVKVESLGKHMLFISNTSSLSAIAPHSRMENKIYFARLRGEGSLFYSLDTGRATLKTEVQRTSLILMDVGELIAPSLIIEYVNLDHRSKCESKSECYFFNTCAYWLSSSNCRFCVKNNIHEAGLYRNHNNCKSVGTVPETSFSVALSFQTSLRRFICFARVLCHLIAVICKNKLEVCCMWTYNMQLHINLAQHLCTFSSKPSFLGKLDMEHMIVEAQSYDICFEYIEEMIHKKEPIVNVLHLLVLFSISNSGLPKENFDYLHKFLSPLSLLWRELLHSYGSEHMTTLNNLGKAGQL